MADEAEYAARGGDLISSDRVGPIKFYDIFDVAPARETTPEERRKEQERRARENEREKQLFERFVREERALLEKAKEQKLITDPEYLDIIYKVKTQNKAPSTFLVSLTKNFPGNEQTDVQTFRRHLKLLHLLAAHHDYPFWHQDGMPVTSAQTSLFHYYIDLYNRHVQSEEAPDVNSMHQLAQRCSDCVPYNHPGIDDFEHVLYYIDEAVRKILFDFRTYNLNHPKLPQEVLVSPEDLNLDRYYYITDRVMNFGARLLQCTTYGFGNRPFDLEHLLRQHKFDLCILDQRNRNAKEKGKTQHVWIHPQMPLQIRVTQDGKLTVSILKQIPYKKNGVIENEVLYGGELLKISLLPDEPEIIEGVNGSRSGPLVALVPSRRKGNKDQREIADCWADHVESGQEKMLMDASHGQFDPGYFDYPRVRRNGEPRLDLTRQEGSEKPASDGPPADDNKESKEDSVSSTASGSGKKNGKRRDKDSKKSSSARQQMDDQESKKDPVPSIASGSGKKKGKKRK
ncbi:MAG: hypothetical protein C0582_04820 [Alphaproteobacteria bacterium]|nr:MAG: hypothetical protein C0582_04820 [Alphaproteobacteria bacterium]